jgi:ABC-type antimicrobial peptide transport system permease subunit
MLWAKILSGESERPNSFSLKTLEILKNMNRKEAEIFNNLTHFLVKYNKDIFLFNNDELLKKYNIIFDQLMILEEYGLITLQPFLSFQYDLVSTRKIAIYTNNKLLLIRGNIEKTNKNFSLKIYTLTTF